jgi:inner membrane protease subunit 2
LNITKLAARKQQLYEQNSKQATMAPSRIFSIFNRNTPFARFAHDFKYWPFTLITWIPAVIFFNGNIGELTWINGASMYPYLNTSYNEDLKKDTCWVSKWYPTRDLKRGMVVSFR